MDRTKLSVALHIFLQQQYYFHNRTAQMARFSILVLFGHINLCSESSSSPTHYWKMLVFALLTLTSAIESVLSDEVMPPEIPNLKQAANGGASRLSQCENGTLNECWSQIPPFPDQGIPSSPESVAASCQ